MQKKLDSVDSQLESGFRHLVVKTSGKRNSKLKKSFVLFVNMLHNTSDYKVCILKAFY